MRLAFDRGTVLVLEADDAHASSLPFVVLDPRVGAWRARAYRYGDIRRALNSAGTPHQRLRAAPPRAASAAPTLRDYPEAALAAWDRQDRRGTVVLPTGAGKTLVRAFRCASRVPSTVVVF